MYENHRAMFSGEWHKSVVHAIIIVCEIVKLLISHIKLQHLSKEEFCVLYKKYPSPLLLLLNLLLLLLIIIQFYITL